MNDRRSPVITALTMLGLLLSQSATASLTDTGDGRISDDDLGIDWVKDGNLFATQLQADPAIVQAIVALTPTVHNPDDHTDHNLSASDFITDSASADFGKMSWFGAMAWINWLNNTQYLSYADWRLPAVRPQNGAGFSVDAGACSGNNDLGYNMTGIESELPHLYYDELGNLAIYEKTTGDCPFDPRPQYGLINSSPFTNLQSGIYWTQTDFPEKAGIPAGVFIFDTTEGGQSSVSRTEPGNPDLFPSYYALPVRGGVTLVSGDYDITGSTCTGKVDRSRRKLKLTVTITNAGIRPKKRAVVQVTATQNGVTYNVRPKTFAVKFPPGKTRKVTFSWKTKGAGEVVFNTSLTDLDDTTADASQDVATCTVAVAEQ